MALEIFDRNSNRGLFQRTRVRPGIKGGGGDLLPASLRCFENPSLIPLLLLPWHNGSPARSPQTEATLYVQNAPGNIGVSVLSYPPHCFQSAWGLALTVSEKSMVLSILPASW